MQYSWRTYLPWIDAVLMKWDWNPSDWCYAADVAPSTLLRPLKAIRDGQTDVGAPSLKTLHKLEEAAGVPIPSSLFMPVRCDAPSYPC